MSCTVTSSSISPTLHTVYVSSTDSVLKTEELVICYSKAHGEVNVTAFPSYDYNNWELKNMLYFFNT